MKRWFGKKVRSKNAQSNTENKISDQMFCARMFISVSCMLVCMVAMISSSYAWFMASVSSEQNRISSANYALEIWYEDDDELSVELEDGWSRLESEDGIYRYECGLACEDKHIFTLKSTGSASKGYCEIIVTGPPDADEAEIETVKRSSRGNEENSQDNIELSKTSYYTELIGQGESLEVRVEAARGSVIEFVPVWGTSGARATYSLRRPSIFYINYSTTPYIEYLVVEGVTLEDLAEYYGVSDEDICIYNDITELTVGDMIKIPGVGDMEMEPYRPELEAATPSNATEATPSDATETVKPSGATEEVEPSEPTESAGSTDEDEPTESDRNAPDKPETTPSDVMTVPSQSKEPEEMTSSNASEDGLS